MSNPPPVPRPFLHPLHGLLLAFPVALFVAALLGDIAYLKTVEMQWSNFASWHLVGALVFGGFTLLWALILAIMRRHTPIGRRARIYAVVLAGMWLAGLANAFQHSRDAWSSVGMPGFTLSLVSACLALVAGWIAHGPIREIARS
ncbi:DUF2231 domain-containing protein [Sphingobium sp. CECT 9361]|uniref:DUF2231 domain-containing protein n=1 Tax=Sphingobium sp. CECT 9361 TaxID=2845384 RepID=UPI001E286B12|nr:DUF2231 domain-containing protein [Sphingobium sp. CECT 9361]CAH0355518.1 hypothetical protein SPH9361_03597 [Sphingobium sp. CECT 9361]